MLGANMSGGGLRRLFRLTAAIGVLVLISALPGCKKQETAAAPNIRPVRTVTVELSQAGETVSLTGEIQPRYQADLGFRVDGKILERPVDVGTQVKKGDLLARLDPQQYRQDLEVAKAEVAKADAEVTRAQAQEYRQRELLKNGHTTQVAYDQALKTFKTAQAEADAARAKQVQASENLGYTDLKADADGVISAIGADPGQVVSAGQMVVRLAQPGEREAVFNLAEAAFIKGIAISPHRPELHFDLGVVYESQHKYDLAAEQYKAALAAAPDNAQARQQLAAMQARLLQPGQNQQSPGPAYR